MAQKHCPECGTEMDVKAEACTHCGFADTAFIRELRLALNEAHKSTPRPEYKGVERRKGQRVKSCLRLLLNGRPALLIDISEGGIRLSTDSLPSDPEVELTIFVKSGPFTLQGEIRWYSRINSLIRRREAGIAFTKVPEGFRALLPELLAAETSQP